MDITASVESAADPARVGGSGAAQLEHDTHRRDTQTHSHAHAGDTAHTMNAPRDPSSRAEAEASSQRSTRWDRLESAAFPALAVPRRRLYRSRKGWVFGVCRGLADYAELPVFWIRLILVALTILSWILPFAILYVVAAFWMKPEPVLEPEAEEDWRAYSSSACHQSQGLAQLKEELDRVETRTLRLERQTSARQFDWERRLRRSD